MEEIALRSPLPYVEVPVLGSAWWGRRWLQGAGEQFDRLGVSTTFDLAWISDFTTISVLDDLTAHRIVLRFFDRLEAYRWMPRSLFRLVAERLDEFDLVLASSRSVQEDLAARGIEAAYLPNGIAIGRIPDESAVQGDRPLRVAYIGAIAAWFDLEAIELWARSLPDVEFVLAGPKLEGLDSSLANVTFLGPVPYDLVPQLLLRASCGIIPFRVDRLTVAAHPLKLYEYLACGCPVLSADLPEVRSGSGIFKYRDPGEGLDLLRRILATPVDRAALRRRVLDEGWNRRIDRVAEMLECQL